MEQKPVSEIESIIELKAIILDNLDIIAMHQQNVNVARQELARRANANGQSPIESIEEVSTE